MKAFFCNKNTQSDCLKKFNSSFTVNKAVKNSIFSCKRRKESFNQQNSDVRYILDGVCELLGFHNKDFLRRSCTEKCHA